MAEKTCTVCKTTKSTDEFRVRKAMRDGFDSLCKSCGAEATRKSRARDPEATRRKTHELYLKNRDRRLLQQETYHEDHREEAAARGREWRRANPEKRRALEAVAEQRKRDALVEKIDRDVLYARDNGVCGICEREVASDSSEDWWIDYIVPLARGGMIEYTNAQVSHPRCNMRKGSKLPAEVDEREELRKRGAA